MGLTVPDLSFSQILAEVKSARLFRIQSIRSNVFLRIIIGVLISHRRMMKMVECSCGKYLTTRNRSSFGIMYPFTDPSFSGVVFGILIDICGS